MSLFDCSRSTGLNWLLEGKRGAATLIAAGRGRRKGSEGSCAHMHSPCNTERLLHLDVEAGRWAEESRPVVHSVMGCGRLCAGGVQRWPLCRCGLF